MKGFNSIYCLLFILFIGLVSCSENKETPEPLSQAAFTQDRNVVESNEVVSFTNTSVNATRYEWDFGNGQTSAAANATASYSKTGTFTVTLTSYNSENIANNTTSTVKVGERYLTQIKVNSIDFDNRQGGTWDLNDGPDLVLWQRTGPGLAFDNMIDLGDNYTPGMLPRTVNLATPIKITNEVWEFQLEDDDYPNQNGLMKYWQFNPYSLSQKNYSTGVGNIQIADWLFNLDFIFEIR